MRAFLSWHWLSQTSWFSCKLTLLMIRCDHDCGDDLDSSHENFAFDKHPWIGVGDGAVQRKEHHRVPGHHLYHARRLPYAQLWHSRPRVHSNKEVRIYDQVTQCWNITKKSLIFYTVCELRAMLLRCSNLVLICQSSPIQLRKMRLFWTIFKHCE